MLASVAAVLLVALVPPVASAGFGAGGKSHRWILWVNVESMTHFERKH